MKISWRHERLPERYALVRNLNDKVPSPVLKSISIIATLIKRGVSLDGRESDRLLAE